MLSITVPGTPLCINVHSTERLFWRPIASSGRGPTSDIVAGGISSLAFSMKWHGELPKLCLQLLAVQDGMPPDAVAACLGPGLGIFVGGSDGWKEQTMPFWGFLARQRGAYFHVGRVNTKRRIHLCQAAGADSFDGSSVSRYAITMPLLDNARKLA